MLPPPHMWYMPSSSDCAWHPDHLYFSCSSKKTNLFSPDKGEKEVLGASTYYMNLFKPSCPRSMQSIPSPCQGILENGAASIDGECSILRSVKSVVINLVIHGCPVSQVWLLLSASSFSLSLGVITPTPPTASQYTLVSWQLFLCVMVHCKSV